MSTFVYKGGRGGQKSQKNGYVVCVRPLSLFNCQILCFIDNAFESSIGALIKIGLRPPRTWYFGSFILHYAFTSLCGGGQFSEEPPWVILPTGSHLHKEEKKGCWSAAGRDFSPVFLYQKKLAKTRPTCSSSSHPIQILYVCKTYTLSDKWYDIYYTDGKIRLLEFKLALSSCM